MAKTHNLNIRGRLVEKISGLPKNQQYQEFRLLLTPEQRLVDIVTKSLSFAMANSETYPVRLYSSPCQTDRQGLVTSDVPMVVLEQPAYEHYIIIRPKTADLREYSMTFLTSEDLARWARMFVSEIGGTARRHQGAVNSCIGVEWLFDIVDQYEFEASGLLLDDAQACMALFLKDGRLPYAVVSAGKIKKGDHRGYVAIDSETHALEGMDEVIKNARRRYEEDEVGQEIEARDEEYRKKMEERGPIAPIRAIGESEVRILPRYIDRHRAAMVISDIIHQLIDDYVRAIALEAHEKRHEEMMASIKERRKAKGKKKGTGGVLSDLS